MHSKIMIRPIYHVLYCLHSFLVVDSSYIPKGTLYNHIQRIDGKIYYSNVLDEYFKENKDSIRKDIFCSIKWERYT